MPALIKTNPQLSNKSLNFTSFFFNHTSELRGHNKIVQHMYTCYSATLESSLDLVGDSDCLVGDSDFLGSSFFWVFFSLSSLFSSSFASFFCSCFGSCLVCSFSSVLSSSMLSSFSRDSDLFFWERLSSLDLLLSWINKHSFEWFKTSYRFINLWIYKILYKRIKIRGFSKDIGDFFMILILNAGL